jgi:histidyl-tRNA synthetase
LLITKHLGIPRSHIVSEYGMSELSSQAYDGQVASGEWRVASEKPRVEFYIAWMGEKAYVTAIRAAKTLRAAGLSVELPPAEQKLGKALGQADKLGTRFALILGDNEVSSGEWTLKTLATGEQQKLSEPDLLNFLEREKAKADPSLRSG